MFIGVVENGLRKERQQHNTSPDRPTDLCSHVVRVAHGGGTQAGTRQHRTPFSPTFDLLLALPGHRVVEAVVAECCVASLFSSLLVQPTFAGQRA
jgi:hypothetical protein